MASFATVEELETHLQVDIAAGTATNAAQQALDAASAAIRSYTGQTISAVSDDTKTFGFARPSGSSYNYTQTLFLPELPVTDVVSVEANGTELVADTDYFVDYNTGSLRHLSGFWDSYALVSTIEVTYSHGYDEVPADVKGVCLSLATQVFQGALAPAGARSESVGGYYSISYGDGTRGAIGPSEQMVLDAYRVVFLA